MPNSASATAGSRRCIVSGVKPILLAAICVLLAGVEGGAQTSGAYLGDLGWPEAEQGLAESPLVILPWGS
jgi:hypothetical protein